MESSVTHESDVVVTEVENIGQPTHAPTLRLRLRPANRTEHRVMWMEGTIDNEHMGKKKSKCCCIFRKPLNFNQSSSEDDEDCPNCFGHPERRKKNVKHNLNRGNRHNEADHLPRTPSPETTDESNGDAKCNQLDEKPCTSRKTEKPSQLI